MLAVHASYGLGSPSMHICLGLAPDGHGKYMLACNIISYTGRLAPRHRVLAA